MNAPPRVRACSNDLLMAKPRKSLFRSLGEFVGHIRTGVRTPVAPAESGSTVVRHEQEERREGNVVLRRTVIEEMEIRREDGPEKAR
jgi:hypothetical protein